MGLSERSAPVDVPCPGSTMVSRYDDLHGHKDRYKVIILHFSDMPTHHSRFSNSLTGTKRNKGNVTAGDSAALPARKRYSTLAFRYCSMGVSDLIYIGDALELELRGAGWIDPLIV